MNDMEIIRKRFQDLIQTPTGNDSPAVREALIRDLDSMIPGDAPGTWCFEDIDYADQGIAIWKTLKHLERIREILSGLGEAYLLGHADYAEKILGAVDYWVVHDFHNPNWWYNEIGMPMVLGNIALMLQPVMSEAQRERTAQVIAKGSMARNAAISAHWTGANLIWGAMNTIRHALLIGDEALLRAVSERTARELVIGKNEGIQRDGSFFQHSRRLYSGGYGRSFLNDISLIIYLFHGTAYQFTEESLQALLLHVLDGLRLMTQGSALDWACVGREISRHGNVNIGGIDSSIRLLLKDPSMPRREELEEYLATIGGARVPDRTRYFPIAAMLCHHFDGIYVGAKFLNNSTMGAEICNGEGELCYNLSYGTHTCIMRDGNEYRNLNPVWDYARVPGTTARTEEDAQLLAHRGWWMHVLPNDHFGGRQDGVRAVIYELAEHDGVRALVSDFAFEHGFVSLGTDISVTDGREEALVTTVEQCYLRGEVKVEGDSILHNRVRYTALQGTRIEKSEGLRRGSWHRNNQSLSDSEVVADVLTLTVTHEAGKAGRYAYMISAEEVPCPTVEVLSNDARVQAIRLADGKVMAVFHEACELAVGDRVIKGDAGAYIEG